MFQLVKCIYQSVQTKYGYNLFGHFLQNLVEESIWPMIATESLKALGGLGLLSLGGKYLLRCIFEEEEALISAHRKEIEETMEIVRERIFEHFAQVSQHCLSF
ncbi:uncharacterized protein LOC131246134 isoform X6 [Magnolia sinica]|uniref:uncharacterized protein LOC131246134 isoform X6 n=1 Tax=Magnolia sinica TaxID=86752 RepID=UPI00265A5B90|nr:uncharacterized protein LOC131246134 isoform X6 [Magnolia sinica]